MRSPLIILNRARRDPSSGLLRPSGCGPPSPRTGEGILPTETNNAYMTFMAKELHHPEREQIELSAVLEALSEPTRREIVPAARRGGVALPSLRRQGAEEQCQLPFGATARGRRHSHAGRWSLPDDLGAGDTSPRASLACSTPSSPPAASRRRPNRLSATVASLSCCGAQYRALSSPAKREPSDALSRPDP